MRMIFAIPLAGGKLTAHFGHCRSFAIVTTDDEGVIVSQEEAVPPPHEPGVLPRWLSEEIGAHMIIAGGMGVRAQQLFNQYGIEVITGAEPKEPQALVNEYLSGSLVTGDNACDH